MRSFISPLIIILISLCLSACQSNVETDKVAETKDPYSTISDTQAAEVLRRAIDASGGFERWDSKTRLSFSKSFQLLLEDGSIENEADQRHVYSYKPQELVEISWQKGTDSHLLTYKDGIPKKMINEVEDTASNNVSLVNSVLSSTFVASLPYKIVRDEGGSISYAGQDTLENGRVVETVQVQYFPDKYDNHSTEDIWQLYFDAKTHHLVAYMVQHADHFSYVRNMSDTIIDGFYFVIDRESYRSTPERELLYLRAVYHYEDYKVEF